MAAEHDTSRLPDVRDAVALLMLRLGLVGLGAIVGWVVLAQLTIADAFPPSPLFSALVLAPVNVICLLTVRSLLHRRGVRARDLMGFRRHRLGSDALWGVLWLAVLYVPFVATIVGVMALLHGERMFVAFESVFFDASAVPNLSAEVALVLAISALFFGVQHVFFAPTADAVIVYAAALTVWGAGSGLIYLRQRRLMPLIIAHGIVNLLTSLPALAIPFFL